MLPLWCVVYAPDYCIILHSNITEHGATTMITEVLYRTYLASLLAGEHRNCHQLVTGLLGQRVQIKDLYLNLFQRSLYEVGEMWERHEISVAVEHMASAITESLLPLAYPTIFSAEHGEKSAVISCVEHERHQTAPRSLPISASCMVGAGYFLVPTPR